MDDKESPQKFNQDISDQLDKRMDGMLDKVEASEDPKAIAAAFRTLVEFSRPKPPTVIDLGGASVNVTQVADDKTA